MPDVKTNVEKRQSEVSRKTNHLNARSKAGRWAQAGRVIIFVFSFFLLGFSRTQEESREILPLAATAMAMALLIKRYDRHGTAQI